MVSCLCYWCINTGVYKNSHFVGIDAIPHEIQYERIGERKYAGRIAVFFHIYTFICYATTWANGILTKFIMLHAVTWMYAICRKGK